MSPTLSPSTGSVLRVNRSDSIIRGVKLLGFESKNGRHYPPATLRKAITLYEGVPVNINHPERTAVNRPRRVDERIGRIVNVRFEEGRGLFGDFHFNPHHPVAEQVTWNAEHQPNAIGFSHHAELRMGTRHGRPSVEEIVHVRSVDLVADPATTRGLFEGTDPESSETPETLPDEEDSDEFGDDELDFDIEEFDTDDPQTREDLERELEEARRRLREFETDRDEQNAREAIDEELRRAGLDPTDTVVCSEAFREQLLRTHDPRQRRECVTDRLRLAKHHEHRSGPRYRLPEPEVVVEAIDALRFSSVLRHGSVSE